ncbi:FixG Ig-like domain-containing protein, partial [Pacificibacter sp.]|uniref:FixG Ig-like domain-containing protein n=1 Tax=Pacificibacter sp. TaxID=1917866 RepID=UPI00321BBB57
GHAPKPIWKHILRPRTMMYTALWSGIGFALVFALFMQSDIDMTVAPVRNPTFVTLSDGSIRNIYDVRLRNKHGEDRPFQMSVTGNDVLRVEIEGGADQTVLVPADGTKLQRVYIVAPPKSAPAISDRTPFTLWVTDTTNDERASTATVFNGKGD